MAATFTLIFFTHSKEENSCDAGDDDDPHDHQGDTEERVYEAGNDDDHSNDDDDAFDDNPYDHQGDTEECTWPAMMMIMIMMMTPLMTILTTTTRATPRSECTRVGSSTAPPPSPRILAIVRRGCHLNCANLASLYIKFYIKGRGVNSTVIDANE